MPKITTACFGFCLLIGCSVTATTVWAENGVLTLDHFAFSPDGSSTAGNSYIKSPTGGLSTSAQGCFTAGINLPDGVTLTKVVVWYKKMTSNAARFALRWRQFSNGRSEAVVDEFLPGSAGLARRSASLDVPDASAMVSNTLYSYGAMVCLGTNDIFWGARIHYTTPNAN